MSLNTSLTTALSSLSAFTAAIENTSNNIANANTPGYTRKIAVLSEAAPTENGGGTGVVLQGYESIRDGMLQGQIQAQTQEQSKSNTELSAMQQVQPAFTTSAQDIGTQMSSLFSSVSALSTNPGSTASRQAFLAAANGVANAFHATSSAVKSQQVALNAQVSDTVTQINSLTQQIAALNPQIQSLQTSGKDASAAQDQQDQLILKLSGLTNVGITQADGSITVTTGNGTALVAGSHSSALQATLGPGGVEQVLDDNGEDITSSITGGTLGGAINTRDNVLAGLASKLDTLASQFGTAMNQANASGFDQNGQAGQRIFQLPTTSTDAAAQISVAISDPALIAASSDGSSGSNGNLARFSAIESTALPAGQKPTDTYASLVFTVGSVTANANANVNAASASLTQLNNQRNSTSGVSIDEESVNLISYQQAYSAAARVVSTIQTLFQVTLSMGTN
jgi:flagellar hook-associated protein 1 FlgK